MAGLVDLHCHILPGIDDGAPDVDAALDLARAQAAGGVAVIAATPHVRPDHPRVRPGELGDRCATLGERLAGEGIPVEIVPGGEVDLAWSRQASADELALVSYGQRGSDMLVETPYGPLDGSFEADLVALRERGYRVLLAHPERSADLRVDVDRLARLVDDGVLVQVTARALLPTDDDRHAFAVRLLREGLVHVLASDAHGAAGLAPADLGAGMEAAGDIAGARARWLSADAPAAILAGTPLPAEPSGGRAPAASRLADAAARVGVRDRAVLKALAAVPRAAFVPAEHADGVSADSPLPIPHDQVTTQPSLVARMVEALDLGPGDRVLEVGTGHGYQAALLARLARHVWTVERWPALAATAQRNLVAAGVTNVTVITGDGSAGHADSAPYDAIIVAAASPQVPGPLVEQLKDGGRLVQPVGPGGEERVTLFLRAGGELVRRTVLTDASFVPLIHGAHGAPLPD